VVTTNRKPAAIVIAAIVIVSIVAYYYVSGMNTPKETIRVSGAFALYPLMVEWAQAYQNVTSGVSIEVSAGGAGKGMTDALNGLVNIGMVSREIVANETQAGAFYVAVTKDCVVATINKDNPVLNDILTKGMTKQMFYSIFIRGNVTNWGQVVGRSDVADRINVYTRADSCGATDNWAKYLGQKQLNITSSAVSGDPGMMQAVQSDHLAIGYNNMGYAYDIQTKAQVGGIYVVPIDINGNGQVDSAENFYDNKDKLDAAVLEGVFPFPPARNEYLVTKDAFTGATKSFVRWILTDGQQYVGPAGYVSLPQSVLTDQLNKLG
jgi:phosphate transport system substrate-binding protein